MEYELTEEEGRLLEQYRILLPMFQGYIRGLVEGLYNLRCYMDKKSADSTPQGSGDGVEKAEREEETDGTSISGHGNSGAAVG